MLAWAKANADAVMVSIVLAVCTGAIGAIYLAGRHDVEQAVAVEDAERTTHGERANAEVARSVTTHTDAHVQIATDLQGARAHGRRQIEQHTQAPAPGTVGPGAVVDPAFAERVLGCVERLRNAANTSAACDAAAADQ